MPKTISPLDFVISARCRAKDLAAILRYYRTKSDNPPRTKGALVSTLISDFYNSLKHSGDLVPFVTTKEALDYLNSQQIVQKDSLSVTIVREDEEGSSNNELANELFKKIEED